MVHLLEGEVLLGRTLLPGRLAVSGILVRTFAARRIRLVRDADRPRTVLVLTQASVYHLLLLRRLLQW